MKDLLPANYDKWRSSSLYDDLSLCDVCENEAAKDKLSEHRNKNHGKSLFLCPDCTQKNYCMDSDLKEVL